MSLFFGCGKSPSLSLQQDRLAHKLQTIDISISQQEAKMLADDIFIHWSNLRSEFAPVGFGWLQNTLVNLGIKQKGLCWHWSDSFYVYLAKRHSSYVFIPAGANIGTLREHNGLVVTTKNKSFYDGVLIDGWRYSDRLFFVQVTQDRAYKWEPRLERLKR